MEKTGGDAMTKFYEVHNEDGRAQALVVHEDSGEHRMFSWLANTKRWYRDFTMENAFYGIDRDMTFVELSPADVVAKVAAWPKLDGQRAGWLIDELTAGESKTSSQLGLPRATPA